MRGKQRHRSPPGALEARIRDVRGGSDGVLCLLTRDADGALLRLHPAATGGVAGGATPGTS